MIIKEAGRLNHIKEYYFSKKLREIHQMKLQGKEVINLGIGNPDQNPGEEVIEVLQKEVAKSGVHGYQSYKGIPELRTAMATWYEKSFNVSLEPEKEVLPLIGSKEGIMHIAMSFLNPGDQVLVPNPGYPAYASASSLAGADILKYDLIESNNYYPDLGLLESKDLSNVKIMWINYPHMPTGTPPSKLHFERLVAFARKNQILLVQDN
ncbi:MAG: aminotransferase class I/II-fold pyridoxal phosphate-dependent enzyme, partial [Bacteroidota bacterium]